MAKNRRRYIIYSIILLVIVSLSVGFSALQRQLLIDDSIFNVRIQEDTRVSNNEISKTGGDAISNFEDYNVSKIYGNVTFPSTSSYVLYKVDLTNYGNIKTGLLGITSNTSGVNFSVCDSNGNNCSNDPKTAVCNGNNCTLGSTKSIYVKVTSTSTGTKNIDLDLDFEPYHTITYENFNENTSSFHTEIMENETYEITLTSAVEEVGISGSGTVNYNKSTHKLTISGVTGNITVTAKYLATDIADTSYTGTNPDNYVWYNESLFRIITKESVDDGYGNSELRTKIISNSSIGNYEFDSTSISFDNSSIKTILNDVYYPTLSTTAKDLIDTASFNGNPYNVGLIDKTNAQNNLGWWHTNQFTITKYGSNSKSSENKEIIIDNYDGTSTKAIPSTLTGLYAISGGILTHAAPSTVMPTHPCVYLRKDTLIVGGTGTSTNPYLLELGQDSILSNPTVIVGRTLTSTGSNQELVTVTNKVGTPYYSTSTQLNSSNYSSSGSTSIPTASSVGSYTVYYYIPAGSGYKAKSGSVTSRINGITYHVNYTEGDNVASIGAASDSCTTTGTNLSCSVTLPTISPSTGWENGRWTDGTNYYNQNTTYTLNSSNNNITLTSVVTGKTYTATIYYYNGSAVASTTAQCNVTNGNSCNFTVPTTVTNSRGIYNSNYKGIAAATNTMATASLTLTNNKTFYAVYSGNVTNYYYNSSYTTRTLKRNEYFTSNSAMTAKLALQDTDTTNYSGENELGVGGSTWIGLSTANDTNAEYNSISDAAGSTSSTLYTIYQFSISYQKGAHVSEIGATGGTCKVTNQNSCSVTLPSITPSVGYTSVGWSSTNGDTTGVTGTYIITTNNQTMYANAIGAVYTATFYYYDGASINTATSNCTVTNVEGNCTVTIPSVVQNSTGQYGTQYKGVASSTSTMDSGSLTISNNASKFYANYSSTVTRYYYSSGYKSNTIYRNEYFINDTTMSSVLTTSDVGTTNYTTSRGPGSSNWLGLSTAQDTTIEYNSVSNAAQSTNTTFYTVYQFVITFEIGANVSAIGSSSSSCNVTTSDTSCTVMLPSITPDVGFLSAGWSETNGATTGTAALSTYTVNQNNRVLYANATGANYLNTTTNEGYQTLNAAFAAVASNQTIKVMSNTTETSEATLASGKTEVKLDLNGKTITLNNVYITNNGELDIYNSSSTNGTITGNYESVINNAGGLTLNGTSYTNEIIINNTSNSSLATIMNGSDLTVNFGVNITSQAAGIFNSGNLTVENGHIRGNTYGIENYNFVAVNGGDILGTTYSGIQNSGMAVMSGGVASSSEDGIFNMGHIEINGAAIEGNNGIYNYGGTAIITSGRITGTTRGIFNTVSYEVEPAAIGSLTLGTNDSSVSINSPVIEATDTSGAYGVYNNGGTFNFYDGIIKSSNGTGYAISGTVNNVPTGYAIYKETTSGVESAILRRQLIATFYYNSNTTNGSLTVSTVTAECAPTSGNSCTITVPSVVTNSVGKYNSAYKGVSTGFNMSSGSLTISANTTFYANYSSPITIYYPNTSNGISNTNSALYRNEYFTSASAMSTITATSQTTTTQATSVTLSNLKGTLSGINYTVNTNTSYAVNNTTYVINRNNTTYYAVTTESEDVTFKYNSNTTCGSATVATATQAVTSTYRCQSTSAMYTTHGTTTTVPSAVSSSKGQYNSNYRAIANVNSLTAVTTFTGGSTYYAIYSSSLTNYYYNSGYTSRTLYRNEYLASSSATTYTARLATSNTSTTNISTAAGPGSSAFVGFSDGADTTAEYSSVANMATSYNETTYTCTTGPIYNVYQFNVTYSKGANVSAIGATSASCNITTSSTSCTVVLPSITTETGYNSVGWSTTNGATTGDAAGSLYTVSTNPTTLYANAVLANYLNTTTNVTYNSLNAAFSAAQNNETIKVLQNVAETSASLSSGKTGIKLDLNGKTITSDATTVISNNGTLDIYNSSSTTGTITGSGLYTIDQYWGTLTLNGTSSTNPIVISNTSNNGLALNMGTNGSSVTSNNNVLISAPSGTAIKGNFSVVTILGGTVTGKVGIETYVGQITIGTDDSTVSTTSPVIEGTASGGFVDASEAGDGIPHFNFYDGVIKSAAGYGYNNSWWIIPAYDSLPSGYIVYTETSNNVESAYLRRGYEATIYYNSNTTSGSYSINTTKTNCYITSGSSCTITVPSVVTSSVGKYNSPYKGVSTSLSSMTSSSLTISQNTTYYANYSATLDIYRPSSVSAVGKINAYRNEYFTTTTGTNAMASVVSTANNNTTAMTSISGLWSSATFVGYSTSVNSDTVTSGLTSVANSIKNSNVTTYYVIASYTTEVTATFYYSTAAAGTVGSSTATGTQTRNVYCSSTSEASTSVRSEGSISAPSITTTAPTGTAALTGFATTNTSMSTTTTYNTGTTKYYKVYRNTVTVYKPSTTSACNSTNTVFYRNAYINTNSPTVGTTTYTTVLATTNTETTENASYTSGVSGYDFIGFTTNSNSITVAYSTIALLRASATTTAYALLSKEDSVTTTFYYSNNENGTTASKTASGTQTTYLRCTSTSAAGTSVSNGTITAPTLTGETAPTGTTALTGFATSNTNMSTTSTYNTGTTKYYRVYRSTVTVYKPSSTSACNATNTTFYRNAYLNTNNPTVGTTKYTTVLSTTNTGTSENASYTSGVTGYNLLGFATSSNSTTIAYSTIALLRASATTTAYAVLSKEDSVTATFYYSTATDGTIGSKTADGIRTTYLRCTSTSASGTTDVEGSITAPTLTGEVAPTGTAAVNGFATSPTSMSTVTTYTTAYTKYYRVYRNTVTIYKPSSTSACNSTNTVFSRNAYINTASPTVGTTKYTTVLADSSTGTSDFGSELPGTVSGFSFAGYSTSVNTSTVTSGLTTVLSIKSHASSTYYAIGNLSENVTFKYNSNTTVGSATISSATSSVSSNQYCSSTTASTITHGTTTTVPSAVSSSVGQYNTPYRAVAAVNSLASVTTFTGGNTYYAVYNKSITYYYATSSSYTNTTLHRNEYLASASATEYTSVIGSSNTATSNYTPTNGRGNSTFVGLSTAQDTTAEYGGFEEAATATDSNASYTKLYAVYMFDVTFAKGAHVEAVGSGSGYCNVVYNSSSCTVVLPTITPEIYYNSVGWRTTNGATTGTAEGSMYTISTNGTTLYANAVKGIIMEGSSGSGTSDYLRTTIKRQDIESITFANSKNGHVANGTDCWDVSNSSNGSVLAWVTDSNSNGKYEMTIGSNGKIFALSGRYLFSYLPSLISLSGLQYLDTSDVTNFAYMFTGSSNLASLDVSGFDTSKAIYMQYMFFGCSSLTTLDLTSFNTSQVTDMSYMFTNCSGLTTLNISSFNTSQVINMNSMFFGCSSLTTLDLTSFNTSQVTNMGNMFTNCSGLTTLDLTNFNTSQVTNMTGMFSGCSGLTSLNISSFNTSQVTNMDSMFGSCSGLTTLDLTSFNTSQVTAMNGMFSGCHGLTTLDLSHFNTSQVTNMSYMFNGCSGLTSLNVSSFNTSQVTNMVNMFSTCSKITELDLYNFNTSQVTNMNGMFSYNSKLVTIYASSSFDTSLVTTSTDMFHSCIKIVGSAGTTYSSSYKDKTRAHLDGGTANPGYFSGYGGTLAMGDSVNTTFFNSGPILKTAVETITFQPYFDEPAGALDSWDASLDLDNSVIAYYTDTDSDGLYEVSIQANGSIYAPSDSSNLFRGFTNVTSFNGMQYFDTTGVSTMQSMFQGCVSLTTIDVSHFNTSEVSSFRLMFGGSSSYGDMGLTSIVGLQNFDTSNVTTMVAMFQRCTSLTTLNLNTWDTSNVEDFSNMFYYCTSLTTLNISNFDTHSATVMQSMFLHCESLTSLDVTNFYTANIVNMSGMFQACTSLTSLDLSHFDTSSAETMLVMFAQCSNLTTLDLSTFNTSNVTNMQEMFNGCTKLRTIYVNSNFVTTAVTASTNMFKNCNVLVGGLGTVWNSSYIDVTRAKIDGGSSNPGYFTEKNAKRATFYYNTNTTNGELTVNTVMANCIPSTGQTSCLITVPTVVLGSVGQYNSPYKNVSSSTGTMAVASLTISGDTTFYANYSGSVTNYYYSSGYKSRTIYRNEYFTSTSAMTQRLATSNTGTTNYSTATGPGSSVWYGLSTAQDTTREYSSVASAATSDSATLYTIYTINATYAKGANVSAIGSTSGSCRVTTSSTGCNVTLPSITPNSGYTSVGWNQTNGATTGTAAGQPYTISTNGVTIYANAKLSMYTITLNNHGAATAGTTAVYESYGAGIYLNSGLTTLMTTSQNAITKPTKTGGNVFLGYFTAETGGTELISADGFITSAFTSTYFNANTTLHAQWAATCSAQYYQNCPEAQLCYPSGTTYVYSKTSGTNDVTYDQGELKIGSGRARKVYYVADAANNFTQLVTVLYNYCTGLYAKYTDAGIGYANLSGCSSTDINNTYGFELKTTYNEPGYITYMYKGCVTPKPLAGSNYTSTCQSSCSSGSAPSSGGGSSVTRYCYRCSVPPNAIWYQWATSNPGSNYCEQVSNSLCQ